MLLVISAQEGVKPQTEEHLAICNLLGVRRGVVAVTKVDTVSQEQLEATLAQIQSLLGESFLGRSNAATVTVSARTGAGLDDLRSELKSLAMGTRCNQDHGLRLPIDRAFIMKGFGTVVTGTLLSGSIETGQSLALEPGGLIARVRGVQVHNRPETQANGRCRVALNLAGIDVSEISRGQTLVDGQSFGAVTNIDVEVTLLPSCSGLKHRARVHFHAFTSDAMAAVSLYGYKGMEAGESRLLRLKLAKPMVLVPGDRFVLRQASPAVTIGGGRILGAHPIANLRKSNCLQWLDQLRNSSLENELLLRVSRRGISGMEMRQLMTETGLSRDVLLRATKEALKNGSLIQIPCGTFIAREHVDSSTARITALLNTDVHGTGLKRSALKSRLNLHAEVLDFVIEMLAGQQKLVIKGEVIHDLRIESPISSAEQNALAAIENAFRSAGLATPSVAEVAAKLQLAGPEMRRLMTLLLREKTLLKMGHEEVYLHRDAVEALRRQLSQLSGQSIDVAGFKQMTGVSRKYAIPLLEFLDRERVTRKVEDRRIVL